MTRSTTPVRRTLRSLPLLAVVMGVALAGCGDPTKRDRLTQAAARVNAEDITVPQINVVLQQQRGLRPDQTEAASRIVLERLINQELAVQRAAELKLDRDPQLQLQLEAARRSVLARAYAEHVGAAALAPSADEVRRYYDEHPALFKERRLYSLQELMIEAAPEQLDRLRAQLAEAQPLAEFVDWLRANGYRFTASQAVRAAEQLPRASLDALAKLQDGQALLDSAPGGARVVVLAGSRDQPVSLEQAAPVIEQALLAERRRALVREDLAALRQKARIEYVGRFAASPPPPLDAAASGVALDDVEPPAR